MPIHFNLSLPSGSRAFNEPVPPERGGPDAVSITVISGQDGTRSFFSENDILAIAAEIVRQTKIEELTNASVEAILFGPLANLLGVMKLVHGPDGLPEVPEPKDS